MNKALRLLAFSIALSFAAVVSAQTPRNHPSGRPPHTGPMMPPTRTLTTPPPPVASPAKEEVKNSSGEQFFIIASVDRQNQQLLLKRPTEVTVLVKLADNTKYIDGDGKSTKLASFRAGDTVWAKLSGNGPEPTLVQMREGEMTISDLHRYYLNYAAVN